MKKVFAVLLALSLTLGMALSSLAEVTYPLVKDGEEITFDVVWGKAATSKPIAEMKVVKDVQEISGVNFNVIEISDDGFDEKRNLMIASGDLPDIFMEGIGTKEIVNYKDSCNQPDRKPHAQPEEDSGFTSRVQSCHGRAGWRDLGLPLH